MWVPVRVEVSLENEAAFDGFLRLGQFDGDGDVCYDRVEVHLRSEGSNHLRQTLYVPANAVRNRGVVALQLLRQREGEEPEVVRVLWNGETVPTVQIPEPLTSLGDDRLLILEVSTGTAGRVADLEPTLYTRAPAVGHISPTELPELWLGLEMLDCVIWDGAEVTGDSPTPRQIEALLQWVRYGGTLVIAAGRTAPTLAQTAAIDAALPCAVGEIVTTRELAELRFNLLYPDLEQRRLTDTQKRTLQYPGPVPTVLATVRRGARVLLHEPELPSDVLTERRLDRGRIVFCGLTLKDMFAPAGIGSPTVFFEHILHLQRHAAVETPPESERTSLLGEVGRTISFTPNVGFYLLIVLVFSLVYVGVATLGLLGFLNTRGWRQHNWTAFAAAAIAASLLSVVAVGAVRGVGNRVHQLVIVDADAGSHFGSAAALFGLKCGTDNRLDAWLPADHLSAGVTEPGPSRGFLRPLGETDRFEGEAISFVDPTEYRLLPGSAGLDELRVRATLKRLEGRWEGSIGGTVSGRLDARPYSGYRDMRFTEDSYIANELGFPLHDCYLVHAVSDVYTPPQEGRPARLRDERSDDVYVYPLGTLPGDGTRVLVARLCYRLTADDDTFAKAMARNLLSTRQQEWARSFTGLRGRLPAGLEATEGIGLTSQRRALLLLSTLGEWNQDRHMTQGMMGGGYAFTRDRLRFLDLREQLQRDSAVLIGFAADPGPVRLAVRRGDRSFRPVSPDRYASWTMYRFRFPLNVPGGTPPPEPAAAPAPTDEDALPPTP